MLNPFECNGLFNFRKLRVGPLSACLCWTLVLFLIPSRLLAQTASTTAIDPAKIISDLSSNAVRAELQYKGKVLSVLGRVVSIEVGRQSGNPGQIGRVGFESPTVDRGNLWYCGIDSAQQAEVASLEKGDLVTLRVEYISLGTFAHCKVESDVHVGAPEPPVLDPVKGFYPPAPGRACRSSIEAVKIRPHVYSLRSEVAGTEGWRYVQRMAVDLRLSNVGTRSIDAVWFEINANGGRSTRNWDEARISLAAAATRELHFPSDDNFIELFRGYESATIVLTRVRYTDGMIQDFQCELGTAPIATTSAPASTNNQLQVEDSTEGLSPPRLLESPSGPSESPDTPKKAIFSMVVGEDGEAHEIKLLEGSLGAEADQREIETIKRWSFVPATKSGKPVNVRLNISVCLGQKGC